MKYFAYPQSRYDSRIVKLVKKAGYKAAFIAYPQHITSGINPFLLPRIVVDQTHQANDMPAVYSRFKLTSQRWYYRFNSLNHALKKFSFNILK